MVLALDHAHHKKHPGIYFQKTKNVNRRISFFDFDGTITTKDTLLEFVKHSKGAFRFYLGFLLTSPWMLAYKLKVISNHKAKERFLSFFFRHRPMEEFQQACESFATTIIPRLIRPKALTEIARLRDAGAEIVIVSASPENWIRPWADKMGVKLLSTRLAVKDDRLTGKIMGRNCHGEEKVRRIKEAYDLADYDEIYAYGDTKGDLPMLHIAKISFYKPFL
jgi:phosphatidylglycerophosphatase C